MPTAQTHSSVAGKAARFVARDVIFDVVRFPVWWYSVGLMNVLRFVRWELLSVADRLSIKILFRNLLKPMYGDTTRSGRIISLVMRLIVFVFRFIGLVFWTVLLAAAIVLWLAALPAIVFQLVVQMIGS